MDRTIILKKSFSKKTYKYCKYFIKVYDEERYFNVLHLCGMGKGGDGKDKHPNGNVRGQEIEEEEAMISFSGKDANGSRISMDKRDIVIEHGHAGR